ncbi:cytochrome C oxidase copper chaperone-domain-containing protein [Papiliotrema laurentii]|uniref:Cytochrome C oxidase copper chaperone-domain-containing protein n=1 Tax=Papiliotrema laurentii TaxID=5418 RepID=A0AAD9CS09_PAPLA|nr:cytochrome C oxidase copper chaperone-domain-containing protein [Papiliotrema laurentii]
MSSSASSPADSCTVPNPQTSPKAVNPLNPNGVKPCCACPETKDARDKCFFNFDPEVAQIKCKDYVEAHRACMASFGFKI